jgi:hypothetical protein
MRRVIVIIAVAGLGISCATPSSSMTAEHAAAIQDSARVFLSELSRLSAAAQWDSLGGLYSDRADFRFLESGAVQYANAAAVRTALAGVAPGQRIETRYDDIAVQALAPGLAAVSARFSSEFRDSSSVLFGFSGVVSIVLAHEPGGWRIASGHSSVPVPR